MKSCTIVGIKGFKCDVSAVNFNEKFPQYSYRFSFKQNTTVHRAVHLTVEKIAATLLKSFIISAHIRQDRSLLSFSICSTMLILVDRTVFQCCTSSDDGFPMSCLPTRVVIVLRILILNNSALIFGHLTVLFFVHSDCCFIFSSAASGKIQTIQLLCELRSPTNLKDAVCTFTLLGLFLPQIYLS